MPTVQILPPFPIFTDVDGNALEDGYIYIGEIGLNPETNPISVFWDAELTISAAQPIRTLGGYPSRAGTPARLYSSVDDYSITVRNKNSSFIYSSLLDNVIFTSPEWLSSGVVPVFIDGTHFSVPGDQTDVFQVNRRVQAFVTTGTIYGYVTAAVFSTPSTIVTMVWDTGALDAGLTVANVAMLEADHPSVPRISSDFFTFLQAGTGAVLRTAQSKMRESISVMDFGAVGDGITNDTAAVNAWIAAIPSGGMGYVPSGSYAVDPITVNKSIFLRGESTRSGGLGSRFIARGNQTNIFKFVGAGFPTILFGWGIEDISFYGGAGITISDAALLIQDAGMGNFKDLVITNVTGSAIRIKNGQDLHFLRPVITDCGDNTGKAVVVYDPTSSNNCNNIYWIDPHFESMAYSIMTGSGTTDDIIQIIGGKNENRTLCNGITSTDLAFPLFDVNCDRFSCHDLTMTNIHLFSSPTFKIYGAAPQITGIQVSNSSAQTGDFVSVDAGAIGYVIKNNGGFNISSTSGGSGITNVSTKHGDVEPVWWANNSIFTNKRAVLDAVAPPIERMTSNAGGDYIYGSAGSLLGKSISFATNSDPVGGILLPIGYPFDITVHWRVKASAGGNTVSLGVRTQGAVYTAKRTGVSVGTSFATISMSLNPTDMATAFEAVILKEGVGADNLIIDAGWIEYASSWITPTFSAGNFTGSGGLTWAVEAGDILTYTYKITGKQMTVAWNLVTTSTGGVADLELRIAIPDGRTATKTIQNVSKSYNAGGGWVSGFALVSVGTTYIALFSDLTGGTNWSAAAVNNTYVVGELTFEIN